MLVTQEQDGSQTVVSAMTHPFDKAYVAILQPYGLLPVLEVAPCMAFKAGQRDELFPSLFLGTLVLTLADHSVPFDKVLPIKGIPVLAEAAHRQHSRQL